MVGTAVLSRPCLGLSDTIIGKPHGRAGVGPHKPSPAHPHHCVPQVLIPAYAGGGILVPTGGKYSAKADLEFAVLCSSADDGQWHDLLPD